MQRNPLLLSALSVVIAMVCGADEGRAAPHPQRQTRINDGWAFAADTAAEPSGLRRAQWSPTALPHTWNALDAVDNVPGYRRAAGWYRRTIDLPPLGAGRAVLCFEGVNITSRVYVNGRLAGGHVGGYVGYEVDVTPFARVGRNTVLVRADNSYDLTVIPSQKSDFFIYGGITRDVWLKIVPAVYIAGVRITTPAVSRERGETVVRVSVTQPGHTPRPVVVEVDLLDPRGLVAARVSREVPLASGTHLVSLAVPALQRPELWSPARPALYTASVRLVAAGGVRDTVAERFGYRWFEFAKGGPFLLNGERLLIRGTHRHEEHAGLGAAMPDSLHRRDMEMIKAMGANFVRLAHYPQDPEVYRACDELGILVWDELPWCRGGVGGAVWKENTRRLLREQIEQNANHPSIVVWSLGNELYWLPDVPGGDNVDSLRAFFGELNALAHALDPLRPTGVRKFYEGADLPDLFSPSIWAGWYSGAYRDYERTITDARRKYPRMLHMEYGGDSHAGRHTESPVSGDGSTAADVWDTAFAPRRVRNVSVSGDWSETYIVDLFDWHLHVSESLDWLTGNAQWALKDFGTPLRPENPIPYVNQKGLLDRAGNPKDAYYVFKSYWTTDPRFCYIQSHTWTERSGPQGAARPVRVYSNCDEVELFLNGESQGRKSRDPRRFPAGGLVWEVQFAGGANVLAAAGRAQGATVALDSTVVRYSTARHGEPAGIELSAVRLPGGGYRVEAMAVDKEGRRCLDYNRRVYFSHEGAGRLVVDQGTPTGSQVIEMAGGRAAIEFLPARGRAVIEARNQDFKGSYLILMED